MKDGKCCEDGKCECGGKWFSRGKGSGGGHGSSAVYGMGLIGALVYYLQHVTSLNMALIGIFKALFWPAFLIYKVSGLLKI